MMHCFLHQELGTTFVLHRLNSECGLLNVYFREDVFTLLMLTELCQAEYL